jgi:hypothetical protein
MGKVPKVTLMIQCKVDSIWKKLPPPIATRFGRRLESLGWIRDDTWTPYCFRLR